MAPPVTQNKSDLFSDQNHNGENPPLGPRVFPGQITGPGKVMGHESHVQGRGEP